MESLLGSPGVWVALVFVAAAAGFSVGRTSSVGARKARELEAKLEAESSAHEKTREETAAYKQAVTDHFAETSARLHDLTLQYRSVYEHLAKGASELCPGGFSKLEGGLGLDALPEEAAEAPPVPEARSSG